MQLQLNPIPVSFFTASKTTKILVTERSDCMGFNLLQQLYDDACDVGVAVYNPDTHKVTYWYWEQDVKDHEGDLIVSIYKPTHETLRSHPQLTGWSVRIQND